MAVESKPFASTLQMVFLLGTKDGKNILRRKSYTNIKNDASHQDIFDVAMEIAALQTHVARNVYVSDRSELVQG